MIRRKEILKAYRISRQAFFMMVNDLPEATREIIKKHEHGTYFNNRQQLLIKECFGDWEKKSFYSKQELIALYGVSRNTFKRMLAEVFGREHEIVKNNSKFYSAKQVLMIEAEIGEP